MNIKKVIQFITRWIFVIVLTMVIGVGALMLYQYYDLKNQAQRLFVLQEEYHDYLLKLRVMVDEFQKITESEPAELDTQSEKKKEFVTVNRAPEYLENSLIQYLKENKLEHELRSLERSKRLTRGKQQRVRRKRGRTLPLLRNVQIDDVGLMNDITRRINQEISFIWPLELYSFYISSYFGPRKKANGKPGFHYGIDLPALKGTPIKAAAAGKVIEAGYAPGYGNTIVVAHTPKYKTRYAHLSKILVISGQHVKQGERIGRVGSTGRVRSRGNDPSHLHFEVTVMGNRINPLWILPKIG